MPVQDRVNNDTTPFIIRTSPAYREDNGIIAQDALRAAILAQFTLMAKRPVTVPTTMAANVGNTGNGTVTGVKAAPGAVPIVGTYTLECLAAVLHGGMFKLTDPNGNIVGAPLTMNPGAGLATSFVVAGLEFIITDGAVDFVAGDKFTLAVVANGKYVPFDPAAALDSIPVAIYMGDDITAAALVAGNVVDSPMLFMGAKFDEDKLVFDDGATTIDTLLSSGKTIRETLREIDLVGVKTQTASAAENV